MGWFRFCFLTVYVKFRVTTCILYQVPFKMICSQGYQDGALLEESVEDVLLHILKMNVILDFIMKVTITV